MKLGRHEMGNEALRGTQMGARTDRKARKKGLVLF
jgi:hypothetical protein